MYGYPQRPGEDIRFPGAGVTGVIYLIKMLGTEKLGSSGHL